MLNYFHFVAILGLFEGDIVIDEDSERYLTGGEIMSRDAVVNPILYWPKGIVYYKFDEALGVLLTVKFPVKPQFVDILLAVLSDETGTKTCKEEYLVLEFRTSCGFQKKKQVY